MAYSAIALAVELKRQPKRNELLDYLSRLACANPSETCNLIHCNPTCGTLSQTIQEANRTRQFLSSKRWPPEVCIANRLKRTSRCEGPSRDVSASNRERVKASLTCLLERAVSKLMNEMRMPTREVE